MRVTIDVDGATTETPAAPVAAAATSEVPPVDAGRPAEHGIDGGQPSAELLQAIAAAGGDGPGVAANGQSAAAANAGPAPV